LLIDFPLSQIREDFFATYLVQRIIQFHGIDEYPKDVEKLLELQDHLNLPRHHVSTAILEHFARTHHLEDIYENQIDWVDSLISDHLIRDPDTKLDEKLTKNLVKVLE
jgi:hypothetical protein